MKRILITLGILAAALIAIIALKYTPGLTDALWSVSAGGTWMLPLVIISAILDSVHPCSFSILLITIAFLFALQLSRGKILLIGSLYIAGIFFAYFAIGIGILQVLHIFSVPHFMGKLGAALLVIFGLLNVLGALVPNFPIKLKIPAVAHHKMGELINTVSLPAAFFLGALVGLCQFPCMGGPYLMVIGLLHDTGSYTVGLGYLLLYNVILILPLAFVLYITADRTLVEKMQEWKKTRAKNVHLYAGIVMIVLGLLISFI